MTTANARTIAATLLIAGLFATALLAKAHGKPRRALPAVETHQAAPPVQGERDPGEDLRQQIMVDPNTGATCAG